jgi:hypothetical protein
MKLKNCKIGTIVCTTDEKNKIEKIGHIVGLAKNQVDEIIPVIQWAIRCNDLNNITYKTTLCHHVHLKLYKGDLLKQTYIMKRMLNEEK